jgi:hypothetical protein
MRRRRSAFAALVACLLLAGSWGTVGAHTTTQVDATTEALKFFATHPG